MSLPQRQHLNSESGYVTRVLLRDCQIAYAIRRSSALW